MLRRAWKFKLLCSEIEEYNNCTIVTNNLRSVNNIDRIDKEKLMEGNGIKRNNISKTKLMIFSTKEIKIPVEVDGAKSE